MMRTRPSGRPSVCTTKRTRGRTEQPMVTQRSGMPMSGAVMACGSASAVIASSKDTPCFLRLAVAFRSSHSKSPTMTVATQRRYAPCRRGQVPPQQSRDAGTAADTHRREPAPWSLSGRQGAGALTPYSRDTASTDMPPASPPNRRTIGTRAPRTTGTPPPKYHDMQKAAAVYSGVQIHRRIR